MDFDETPRDCKAETSALLFVKFSLELHMRAERGYLFGRHAAAAVGDRNLVKAVRDTATNTDGRAGFGKFEGVVEKFADDLVHFGMRDTNAGFGDVELEIGCA